MPDDYLDGLRAEDRAAHWEGAPRREDLPGAILVAERAGEVIGFTVREVRYRRRSTSEEISSATPAGTE